MEKKELRKKIEFSRITVNKVIRNERIRILCLLGGSALIVGSISGFLLGYGYTQKNQNGSIPACFEEKLSSDIQPNSAVPSVAEFQSLESQLVPQPVETAGVLPQQADLAAQPVAESQNLEPTLTPQPTEAPDQQAELAGPSDAEPQDVESASVPEPTEYANPLASQSSGSTNIAVARRIKHKSRNKYRNVHHKTRYVTFFPERQNYHYGFPPVGN